MFKTIKMIISLTIYILFPLSNIALGEHPFDSCESCAKTGLYFRKRDQAERTKNHLLLLEKDVCIHRVHLFPIDHMSYFTFLIGFNQQEKLRHSQGQHVQGCSRF